MGYVLLNARCAYKIFNFQIIFKFVNFKHNCTKLASQDASGSGGASSSTEDETWMDSEKDDVVVARSQKDEVFYSRPNNLQVSVEEEPW